MLYGDRAVAARCAFPPEAFFHNNHNGCILDVTQAPFYAKGDGRSDDTAALCAALTFVRDHRTVVSKHGATACSPKINCNWMIYIPDGEYLVSDTVSQSWPALAMNVLDGWDRVKYLHVASPEEEWSLYEQSRTEMPFLHGDPCLSAVDNNRGCYSRGQYNNALIYNEVNWNIRIFGESRDNTIIRLRDGARGFEAGHGRPVLSFSLLERGSNVNLGNFLENLTIDTGNGNPGAVALWWSSSNWGGVRNVRLCSGDGTGVAAMQLRRNNATGYCRDLVLEGFDTGIELSAGRESMLVVEHATIRHMRDCGVRVGDARSGGGGDFFNGRKLLLEDMPLGVYCGQAGQGILLESCLSGVVESWRVAEGGFCLWRDSEAEGVRFPDWSSAQPVGAAGEGNRTLPVCDVPVLPSGYTPERWASVEAFGARGDGVTDDTEAVQLAMNSGKPVICFTHSNYVINGCVDIPGSVQEIVGLFAGIQRAAGNMPSAEVGKGIFRVAEAETRPLMIRQIITAGGVFLDHEAFRPVVLEDILVWFNHCRMDAAENDMLFPSAVPLDESLWRLYRNTCPAGARKQLFVTDCLGFAGDDGSRGCAVENVSVWGRSLDTEHVLEALYSFRRCDVWIFGFKSENSQTLIRVSDHSRAEVLGGTFLNFLKYDTPLLVVVDSQLTGCFLFWHWQIAPPIIRRDRNGEYDRYWDKTDFSRLVWKDTAVIFCTQERVKETGRVMIPDLPYDLQRIRKPSSLQLVCQHKD